MGDDRGKKEMSRMSEYILGVKGLEWVLEESDEDE